MVAHLFQYYFSYNFHTRKAPSFVIKFLTYSNIFPQKKFFWTCDKITIKNVFVGKIVFIVLGVRRWSTHVTKDQRWPNILRRRLRVLAILCRFTINDFVPFDETFWICRPFCGCLWSKAMLNIGSKTIQFWITAPYGNLLENF